MAFYRAPTEAPQRLDQSGLSGPFQPLKKTLSYGDPLPNCLVRFSQCTTWGRVTRIGGTLAPDPLNRSTERRWWRRLRADSSQCFPSAFGDPAWAAGSTMTPQTAVFVYDPSLFRVRRKMRASGAEQAVASFVYGASRSHILWPPLGKGSCALARSGERGPFIADFGARLWRRGFYGGATKWLVSGLEGFLAKCEWGNSFRQQLGLVYNRHPEEVAERAPVGPREPACGWLKAVEGCSLAIKGGVPPSIRQSTRRGG